VSGEASVERDAVATGTEDERPVEVLVDPVITYFLVHVTFPHTATHVGSLRVYKKQSLASKLWPGAQALLDPTDKKIQERHKTTDADKDEVSRTTLTSEESGKLMQPEVLLDRVPCMNFDLNKEVDIVDKTLIRIRTWHELTGVAGDKGTFMFTQDAAYGKFPRLAFWVTLARIHCGREWRASHLPDNLRNGHLVRDKDDKWTELTGTKGCIRVSQLWMKAIFEALAPISNMTFTHPEVVEKDGYEPSTAGQRRATAKVQAETKWIGFLYAEKAADATWCFAKDLEANADLSAFSEGKRAEILGEEGASATSVSVCDTVDWSSAQFVAFHTAEESLANIPPIPRPRPANL
jgi:hypothetical protein